MVYVPINIDEAVKRECKRRRYSPKTVQTYLFCIKKFLKWCKKDLGHISKKDVRKFLENLSEKDRSGNTMNTYHMAIRFLFVDVLEKRMWINIKYSKIPKTLPIVLTQEETLRLFHAIKNPKHRFIVELMYSAGLRVNELISLRVRDLEIDKNYGWVRKGKGNKDRLFIIAKSLKSQLKEHIKNLNENDYLFKGNKGHISARAIQMTIKKATKGAKISKKIHQHTLRHSFATHLIENSYDVASVQSLLGHNSSETTMVYLHMASPKMINVKSPLDGLY